MGITYLSQAGRIQRVSDDNTPMSASLLKIIATNAGRGNNRRTYLPWTYLKVFWRQLLLMYQYQSDGGATNSCFIHWCPRTISDIPEKLDTSKTPFYLQNINCHLKIFPDVLMSYFQAMAPFCCYCNGASFAYCHHVVAVGFVTPRSLACQ